MFFTVVVSEDGSWFLHRFAAAWRPGRGDEESKNKKREKKRGGLAVRPASSMAVGRGEKRKGDLIR